MVVRATDLAIKVNFSRMHWATYPEWRTGHQETECQCGYICIISKIVRSRGPTQNITSNNEPSYFDLTKFTLKSKRDNGASLSGNVIVEGPSNPGTGHLRHKRM